MSAYTHPTGTHGRFLVLPDGHAKAKRTGPQVKKTAFGRKEARRSRVFRMLKLESPGLGLLAVIPGGVRACFAVGFAVVWAYAHD